MQNYINKIKPIIYDKFSFEKKYVAGEKARKNNAEDCH